MFSHTGSIKRDNTNNFSRNVCNSISTSAAPYSLANLLMNTIIFVPNIIEEKTYINENVNITDLLMLSDPDFSLIENSLANPPMPNKALIELLNACGK